MTGLRFRVLRDGKMTSGKDASMNAFDISENIQEFH